MAIRPGQIKQGGATIGQVLAWDGMAWTPTTVSGGGGGSSSIVQSAVGNCSPGTSATATLGSAPTAGNVLLAVVGYYVGQTLTASSFTLQHSAAQGNAGLRIYSRVVQTGDGTGWTVSEGSSDSMTVIVFEIAGSDGLPSGWSYHDAGAASGTSVSDSVTFASGRLLIVGASSDGGSGNSVTTITPTGYTEDHHAIPTNHTAIAGHVSGTGSAQTISTAWDGTPAPLVQTVVGVINA